MYRAWRVWLTEECGASPHRPSFFGSEFHSAKSLAFIYFFFFANFISTLLFALDQDQPELDLGLDTSEQSIICSDTHHIQGKEGFSHLILFTLLQSKMPK